MAKTKRAEKPEEVHHKWTRPLKNWSEVYAQLAILF